MPCEQTLPTWLLYGVFVVISLLLFFGILQILWIRHRITTLENDGYDKELSIRRDVVKTSSVSNRLQVYGLVVDCLATEMMNNKNLRIYNQISHFGTPRTFSVPHVCSTGVKSINLDIYKMGFLVVKQNEGSDNLCNDIVSGKIQYVIINNKLLMIAFDNGEKERGLKEAILDMQIPQLENIGNNIIFYLYDMDSKHNNVTDTSIAPDRSCVVDIKSFYGISTRIGDQSTILNVKSLVGFQSQTYLPLHVLAYRIM